MASPMFLSGASPKAKTPTVAPTGAPRQVRDGDYITTYAPSGAVLSRVYSPVVRQTQTTNRSEAQVQRTSQANSAQNFINRYQTPAPAQTTKGLFAGNTSSGGGGTLGQVQSAGATSMGSPDTYGGGAIGGSVDPASGSSSTGGQGSLIPGAATNIDYTGKFAGIGNTQADAFLTNPQSMFGHLLNKDMSNNPTLAGLLSPLIDALQNEWFTAVLNPGMNQNDVTRLDKNSALNFGANLMSEYAKPGGSVFGPQAGFAGIQSAMNDKNSALNASIGNSIGDGGPGTVATQYDMLNQMLAPFVSLGTGWGGSTLLEGVMYDLYQKYMNGMGSGKSLDSSGLPTQDFMSYMMTNLGYPATIK